MTSNLIDTLDAILIATERVGWQLSELADMEPSALQREALAAQARELGAIADKLRGAINVIRLGEKIRGGR